MLPADEIGGAPRDGGGGSPPRGSVEVPGAPAATKDAAVLALKAAAAGGGPCTPAWNFWMSFGKGRFWGILGRGGRLAWLGRLVGDTFEMFGGEVSDVAAFFSAFFSAFAVILSSNC